MDDREQAYCVPWTLTRSELFYTIRYAEPTPDRPAQPWVIRQTGIYHRFNLHPRSTTPAPHPLKQTQTQTHPHPQKQPSQSLFILLSPHPNSLAQARILEHLNMNSGTRIREDPLGMHRVVLEGYLAGWRGYLATYEGRVLGVANKTLANYVAEDVHLNHATLGNLRFLETRFLAVRPILANFVDVLSGLRGLAGEVYGTVEEASFADPASDSIASRTPSSRSCSSSASSVTAIVGGAANASPTPSTRTSSVDDYTDDGNLNHHTSGNNATPTPTLPDHHYISLTQYLDNATRSCGVYARTAEYLRERSGGAASLLTSTLAFKDQGVSREQNALMLQLTKAALFLTLLNLMYMPWTFVARLVASSMVWIYILSSIVLTVATVSVYYWYTNQDVPLKAEKENNGHDEKGIVRKTQDVVLKGFRERFGSLARRRSRSYAWA
ncbi:MAG: hypothetical protein Q9160_008442 [Pyrenula sp. 1 TL-2023]